MSNLQISTVFVFIFRYTLSVVIAPSLKASHMPIPSLFLIFKTVIAVGVILFASWLADKKPHLAGFLTALPLVSLIAIAFSYLDHKDLSTSASYARSIVVAVPVSWLFFLPFFFSEKLNLGFWLSYVIGILLLILGYFLHQYIMKLIDL